MKNVSFLTFILLTLCVLFFSSCKKEEEDNRVTNREKILGVWKDDYTRIAYYQKGVFIKEDKTTAPNRRTEYAADGIYYIYDEVNGERLPLFDGTWRTGADNSIYLDEAISIDSKGNITELSSTKFVSFFKSEITIREETYDIEVEYACKR